MTRLAGDFSTVYIPYIDPAAMAATVAQGIELFVVGFDTTPASMGVRRTILDAGGDFHPYRFLYSNRAPEPQVDNVVQAIQQAGDPYPDFLHLDVEPIWGANGGIAAPPPSIAQLEAAMDRIEAAGIRPGELTEPSIYTGSYVFNDYYPGYTGPADRGWKLWCAQWNELDDMIVQLFAGWKQEQLIGKQWRGSTASPIGTLDMSRFLGRSVGPPVPPDPGPPAPDPGPIQPGSALARIQAGRVFLVPILPFVPAAASADIEFQAAEEDLTQ